jgi:fermentation-respiration switch protein FrsA (DUF1100 family)
LLLASRIPELTAVVAYVPSGFLWGAVSRAEDDSPTAFPSWTENGQGLPYVARIRNDAVEPEADGSLTLTPAFLRAIENEDRAEPATIAVERINGPILLISGEDDALWPSAVFSRLIVKRLREHGFTHPVTHLTYEGAGHTIGPRYAPTTVLSGYHPIRQTTINLGGSPAAIASARADSWPKVLHFLAEQIRTAAHAPELASAAAD